MDVTETETLLAEARAELIDRLAALDGELSTVRLARGESVDDEHDPEGSTLSSDWSRLSGMRGDLLARLGEVDAARQSLHQGGFGVCKVCGRSIAQARLDARPWASTCVECAN